MKQQSQPNRIDILDAVGRKTKAAINCVQVGTIRSFDAATQLASVEIAMKQVERVNNDGSKVLREYPLLLECPCVVLFGGVDFLSLPIQAGDSCLVLFNDRDIDYWLNNGAGGFPTTARMHDISDGFALVGVRPLTNSIAGFLANGIRLSHKGDSARIDLKDNLIESIATLFLHNGNMQVTGNLTISGQVFGNAGTIDLNANVTQQPGQTISVGDGATGTFTTVTVVDGIVKGGS